MVFRKEKLTPERVMGIIDPIQTFLESIFGLDVQLKFNVKTAGFEFKVDSTQLGKNEEEI